MPASFKALEARPGKVSEEQQARWVQEANEWYGRAEAELGAIKVAVRADHPFSLDGVTEVAEAFVTALSHSDRLLVKVVSGQQGDLVISNLIHTAILSILLARGLQYPREGLVRLGMAALLHDIGMWTVPETLWDKPGLLSREERAVIKQHPEVGARIIRRLGPEAEWLADIIVQEHERFEGQGYPRGLQGEAIHADAQVIGLADTLDALICFRPYRKRLLPAEAVRELVTKERTAFSTRILKCLIQQFSVFPLGTYVRLNSGETGEVMGLNQQAPLRPVVKVWRGADQALLKEPRLLDLSKTSLVHITEVVPEDQEG